MPKPLPNIKLRSHLHRSSGQCSSLVSIISIDQHYQQDDEFKAFCLTMNEEYEKKNLLKLTIVETGYLKRHYLRLDKSYSSEEADLSAIKLGRNWVQEQSSSLDLLKMPLEIISWKELLEEQVTLDDKSFSEYLSTVENVYETDEIFSGEVDTLSKKYGEKLSYKYNTHKDETLDKACIEAAKSYLLEESSIIFKLVSRGFNAQIYPGNRNAALRHIYKKFFKETNPIPWIRYDIKYPSNSEGKKLNPSNSLFFESSNDSTQSDVEKKSEQTVRVSL